LEDARAEVLNRISLACGFEVKEEDLSPGLRKSITSISMTLRQLIVIKQLLLVEQTNYNRFSSRLLRSVTGKKDEELANYIMQVDILQRDLNGKIDLTAKLVCEEIEAGWASPNSPQKTNTSNIFIEPLKCLSCGAPLNIPSFPSRIAKCEHCGTEYAFSEYLERLGASIKS
jgi:hypothetical protein